MDRSRGTYPQTKVTLISRSSAMDFSVKSVVKSAIHMNLKRASCSAIPPTQMGYL